MGLGSALCLVSAQWLATQDTSSQRNSSAVSPSLRRAGLLRSGSHTERRSAFVPFQIHLTSLTPLALGALEVSAIFPGVQGS